MLINDRVFTSLTPNKVKRILRKLRQHEDLQNIDTLAGEGILSGIFNKFSFSAGYSGFQTDGFRENNRQEDRIANAFAQVELSPSTSIQAEVRYRKLESGDLGLRFFQDDFSKFRHET